MLIGQGCLNFKVAFQGLRNTHALCRAPHHKCTLHAHTHTYIQQYTIMFGHGTFKSCIPSSSPALTCLRCQPKLVQTTAASTTAGHTMHLCREHRQTLTHMHTKAQTHKMHCLPPCYRGFSPDYCSPSHSRMYNKHIRAQETSKNALPNPHSYTHMHTHTHTHTHTQTQKPTCSRVVSSDK
jgi:hypothetical protein